MKTRNKKPVNLLTIIMSLLLGSVILSFDALMFIASINNETVNTFKPISIATCIFFGLFGLSFFLFGFINFIKRIKFFVKHK